MLESRALVTLELEHSAQPEPDILLTTPAACRVASSHGYRMRKPSLAVGGVAVVGKLPAAYVRGIRRYVSCGRLLPAAAMMNTHDNMSRSRPNHETVMPYVILTTLRIMGHGGFLAQTHATAGPSYIDQKRGLLQEGLLELIPNWGILRALQGLTACPGITTQDKRVFETRCRSYRNQPATGNPQLGDFILRVLSFLAFPGAPDSPKLLLFIYCRPVSSYSAYTWSLTVCG